jgi:hypothetical protein
MELFEQIVSELIQELDPRNINLTRDIYNFAQIEKANVNQLPFFLRVGKLKNSTLTFPALVPFIDSKGIIYLYNNLDEEHSKLYIQNLLFELIGKISPNNIDILIYDPVYLGVPFSYISQLAMDNVSVELITDEQHLSTRLAKYIQQSKEFINNKLIHFNGFLDYWVNSDDNLKQYTLFVLNDSYFVKNSSITDTINRITANTRNNNSFFILSDLDEKKSRFSFFDCEFTIENLIPFYCDLKLDLEYERVKDKIFENLSLIKNKQSQKTISLESFNIKEGIKIPIGILLGNKKQHHFKFGNGSENFHAIIGGQSGKGKSVLLNTIIKHAKEKYRADEIKFLLFDCKGVEFNDYKNDKYVLDCESTSDIPSIIAKLKIIEQEFETRRELFRQNNVKSIEQLYEKDISIYRLVCIIDEFQFLFQSDFKTAQFAEDLLVSKIIRTGRSFGIHLIVATQSLGDSVRRSILDNIPLRIALGMTESQSNSFLAYNNSAAKNLDKGLAIYNDCNGEKDANKLILIEKVD